MNSMSETNIPVNRTLVGILALACFAAALAILAIYGVEGESWYLWLSGFVRVGLLLSAFWLALPTRHREAAWANLTPMTLIGMVLAVAAVALRPKVLIPLLILLAVLGLILRPRPKQRPRSRADRPR